MPAKVVIAMNKAAILLCKDDLVGVKNHLDSMLSEQNLRVITVEQNSEAMIPDYMVNILVYFLLKTSKLLQNFLTIIHIITILTLCRKLLSCQTLDKVQKVRGRCRLH